MEDIESFSKREENSDNENGFNDLFSYQNSNDIVDDSASTFDLNSFSSNNGDDEETPKKEKPIKNKKQRVLKILLTVFLIGVITVSIAVGAFMFYAFTMIDGTMEENLNDLALNFTTTIYVDDGDGNYKEYRRVHGEYNRIWMDYDKVAIDEKDPDYNGIPQNLANAFVAIEDKRFFEHEGVDWKRTVGAFVNEFVPIYSSRQGGSTITQQLVKNLTDDRSQKASRKIREIMRARYLEENYSKDTILECYLNTIPLGHGTYGVEVASNYYFNKSVNDLTIAECASIAAITKSPTYYAPDDYPEEHTTRRNSVLYQMYDQKLITKEEYEEAKNSELNVTANKEVLNQNNVNSYFVDALIKEVSEDLAEKYGYEPSHAERLFYNGGYKIYATLDPEAQAAAEAVFADSDTYAIKGKDGKLMTGGITVMDYEGNVKAMVGGIGEKTVNRGFNCAVDAIRQPGSTMKPLAAYAPAIEKDLITYSTIVNDTHANYNGWTPNNWFSQKYLGNITIQFALEYSVNTIPVALVNKLTPQVSYDFLTQKLGITTLNSEDINLSPLGMGGTNGGLNTLESAAAFATFGNGGLYYEPSLYTKITDHDDKVILERVSTPKSAMSEDTAAVMNHLLRGVVEGAQGTGAAAKSYIKGMPIYAKTGTSNEQNDLWFVGGTPYYVASVWCGYEELQSIPNKHRGIALKMWGNVMSKIHSGLEAKEFPTSDYAFEKYYCAETGLLATSECPSKRVGWYRKSNIPEGCTSHVGELLPTPSEEKAESSDAENEGEAESGATENE